MGLTQSYCPKGAAGKPEAGKRCEVIESISFMLSCVNGIFTSSFQDSGAIAQDKTLCYVGVVRDIQPDLPFL